MKGLTAYLMTLSFIIIIACPNWVDQVLAVVFCRRRQTIDGRGGGGGDIDVSLGQFSKIIKLFNSPAAA